MTSSITFPSWWQALAAVPPSKSARDWWASDNTRSPRYDRLFRTWGDPTDGTMPPYYKAEKEKHLVPTLWENFSIFHPADIVSSLYKVLQLECTSHAVDLCWSCEFNLGHRDRQLDIVMHVRFDDHDEILLGEAKVGHKKFDDKDLTPRDVLRRDVFAFAAARRYFLLGDAAIPDDWYSRGYRQLTWAELFTIQSALCDTLPESSDVRQLIQKLISMQFAGHRIETGSPVSVKSIIDLQPFATDLARTTKTERCGNFILCAIQHIRCLADLKGDYIPISYLATEPNVEQIVPQWHSGCGSRSVNEKPYWKLPPRPR